MKTAWAVLLLVACGPLAPSRGTALSAGVAQAWFEQRAGGTDLVRVRVVFPATSEGAPQGARLPGLVFIHGGLVSEERYTWLAERLAASGVVVALPRHALDLALLSVDNGLAARRLLVEGPGLLEGLVDPAHIAVAGHSLGAVAAGTLMRSGGFSSVAYLAGFPQGSDVMALNALAAPALAIAGSKDCSAQLDGVRAALAGLTPPPRLLVLDGVTHYQFTDSDAQDVERGCAPQVTLDDAHRDIGAALEQFLQDTR